MKETLSMVDGRPTLRFERRLKHSPGKVWQALTEPDDLATWFPANVRIHELRPGGRLEFVFPDGAGPTLDGVITELVPEQVLAYSWGDQLLRFVLEPAGADCLLTFTHTFDRRLEAASFAAGWHQTLDGLGEHLDGRTPGPATRHVELLVDADDRPVDGGWLLRVERPLPSGAPQAWAAFAEETVVGAPPPQAVVISAVGAATVVDAAAEKLLEYRWDDGGTSERVRWSVEPAPGGSRLSVTHHTAEASSDRRATLLAAWQASVAAVADRISR
jgi:uncharacterized protein YndB with AHSA1/START domain